MKYLLLLSLAFVFACQPGKMDEINQVKKEALDIHDEVMPKMGDLRRTRKDLMLQADSLGVADSLKQQTFIEMSNEIALANESMMNWMRNFEPDFEGTEEDMLTYFQKQKASIEEVRTAMNESLAKGKEALSN